MKKIFRILFVFILFTQIWHCKEKKDDTPTGLLSAFLTTRVPITTASPISGTYPSTTPFTVAVGQSLTLSPSTPVTKSTYTISITGALSSPTLTLVPGTTSFLNLFFVPGN